jgi:hypothetical protein
MSLARVDEAIELPFRSAVAEGREVTLWVMNCLAGHWLARQKDSQHRTRRWTVGAAVQGHERHFATQKNCDLFPITPTVKSVGFSILGTCGNAPAVTDAVRGLLESQVFHETGNYELKYRETEGAILQIKLLCFGFAHLVDLAIVDTYYRSHSLLIASKDAYLSENCTGFYDLAKLKNYHRPAS